MQNYSKHVLAILAGAILSLHAVAAEKPFATVNGIAISQATADMYLAQGKANGVPDTSEMKNKLREELVRRELMFQAAKQAGFDKKPKVVSQVSAATRSLLAQLEATKQTMITRAYLEDYLKKHPITDTHLKVVYDAYRAKGGDTEYKARHILVKDEAEAKMIIAKLDKGSSKFEELAAQSLDTSNRSQGGDLGWSSPAKFVKPFADALAGLKRGQYSATPVKTEFGYHVIKLEDTRPLKVPSFNDMKPILQKDAEARQIDALVAGLRASAKVK